MLRKNHLATDLPPIQPDVTVHRHTLKWQHCEVAACQSGFIWRALSALMRGETKNGYGLRTRGSVKRALQMLKGSKRVMGCFGAG
jgi:hypothetical protein